MEAAVRFAARKRAEAELATQNEDRPRIEVGAAASEEDKRRFLQRIEEDAAKLAELTEHYAAQGDAPWDAYLNVLVRRLWLEACWLDRTGQYPNGRPMIEQSYWRLEIWALVINGLARFAAGTDKDEGVEEQLEELRREHEEKYGLPWSED